MCSERDKQLFLLSLPERGLIQCVESPNTPPPVDADEVQADDEDVVEDSHIRRYEVNLSTPQDIWYVCAHYGGLQDFIPAESVIEHLHSPLSNHFKIHPTQYCDGQVLGFTPFQTYVAVCHAFVQPTNKLWITNTCCNVHHMLLRPEDLLTPVNEHYPVFQSLTEPQLSLIQTAYYAPNSHSGRGKSTLFHDWATGSVYLHLLHQRLEEFNQSWRNITDKNRQTILWGSRQSKIVNGYIALLIKALRHGPFATSKECLNETLEHLYNNHKSPPSDHQPDPFWVLVALPLLCQSKRLFKSFKLSDVLKESSRKFFENSIEKWLKDGIFSAQHFRNASGHGRLKNDFRFLKGLYFPFAQLIAYTHVRWDPHAPPLSPYLSSQQSSPHLSAKDINCIRSGQPISFMFPKPGGDSHLVSVSPLYVIKEKHTNKRTLDLS